MSPEPNRAPHIFDRDLLARHMARRAPDIDDYVTRLAVDDLAERLAPIKRRFARPLIMAPDARPLPEKMHSADGEIAFTRAATLAPWDGLRIDPENLSLPGRDYDLIVSLLDLQCINDVPGFLARIHAHLVPDGLMLIAAIGGNSLQELRRAWLTADAEISGGAWPRVAPFIDVRDAGSLLQRAGFALPMADIEQHVVRYPSALELMRDLRALGASNPLVDRPRRMAGKTELAAAVTAYMHEAGDPDGRVRATLEFLWLSGWSPHESQQKPLKPGSAEVSLTQVLKPNRSQ